MHGNFIHAVTTQKIRFKNVSHRYSDKMLSAAHTHIHTRKRENFLRVQYNHKK